MDILEHHEEALGVLGQRNSRLLPLSGHNTSGSGIRASLGRRLGRCTASGRACQRAGERAVGGYSAERQKVRHRLAHGGAVAARGPSAASVAAARPSEEAWRGGVEDMLGMSMGHYCTRPPQTDLAA